MANADHLELLKQGVERWNAWRLEAAPPWGNGPDLSEAFLVGKSLKGVDLSGSNLRKTTILRTDLRGADLKGSNLRDAVLLKINLNGANLSGTDLRGAILSGTKLKGANLRGAVLIEANLRMADLSGADLTGADLRWATLAEAKLENAVLSGCHVYGVSAWNVKLSKGTKQQDLVITLAGEPEVTVDNIEVAQFVYLLLHNEKIRDVIDTVTSKVVLILGRFTPERKAVLDAIREELRNRHYVPILFDFEPSARRDITETVTLLARMALFIIADLTEPSSIPKELEAIVPHLAVPVQPLLEGERPYAMFTDYWKYDWVLPVHRYDGLDALLGTLADKVIVPAETMTNALAEKRRRFEAELVKSR
jgi:Pentapeptide repeats (8 copies)